MSVTGYRLDVARAVMRGDAWRLCPQCDAVATEPYAECVMVGQEPPDKWRCQRGQFVVGETGAKGGE